jgi:ribosomal protein S27E
MGATGSTPSFRRCYTCGRYVARDAAYNDIFCSPACSYIYVACSVCGRYYRASTGSRAEQRFCSAGCAVRFRLVGGAAVPQLAEGPATASPA